MSYEGKGKGPAKRGGGTVGGGASGAGASGVMHAHSVGGGASGAGVRGVSGTASLGRGASGAGTRGVSGVDSAGDGASGAAAHGSTGSGSEGGGAVSGRSVRGDRRKVKGKGPAKELGLEGGAVSKVPFWAQAKKDTSASKHPLPSPVEFAEPKCDFCPIVNRNGGTLPSPMLGPFTHGNRPKRIYVHLVCAMWAPEVFHDPESNELSNVTSAYLRSRGLKCTVCRTNGATVGCYVPTCQNVYHFCCLYGSPPASLSPPDNNGQCTRHDAYYAAFCPAHVVNANDDVYVQQIKADAELSSFLRDRAGVVEDALEGAPGLGTDCPGFNATAIRRNETETTFCRAWRVASTLPTDTWVTVAGRAQRQVLRRGERLRLRDVPRRIPDSALDLIGGSAARVVRNRGGAGMASHEHGGATATVRTSGCGPTAGAPHTSSVEQRRRAPSGTGDTADVHREGAAVDEPAPRGAPACRRSPVFLLRSVRRSRALGRAVMRRSPPAVPASYLGTTVVAPAPTRTHSLPEGTLEGGGSAMAGRDGPTVGGIGLPASSVGDRGGTGGGGGPGDSGGTGGGGGPATGVGGAPVTNG